MQCSLISLQLLSLKNREPHGREPPSTPCLGCGPALFCFHYHTLLCNLHKYRVIFYRVAQKIEPGKKIDSLLCARGACRLLIEAKDLPLGQGFGAHSEGSRRNAGTGEIITRGRGVREGGQCRI